jgi:hypothetical protein
MNSLTRGLVFSSEVSTGVMPDIATTLDRSRWKNNGTNTAITYSQLPSGLYVHNFDGAPSKIVLAKTLGKVQSVLFWIKPTLLSRSICDFDAGTHSVEMTAGSLITATGWAAPNLYVVGATGARITINQWNMVAVTTATSFVGSAFVFGQEASFYSGQGAAIQTFNYLLTAGQIFTRYEARRRLFGV